MSAPIPQLNVLIYSGPGASATCIQHATITLTALLSPTYAVGTISLQALLNEPWQPACALLVFPGGADKPYCADLGGASGGTRRIADYVGSGGSYLGLCAGGYFGSAQCEFEVGNPALQVVGRRELAFFPGTCRGSAFKGFQYSTEAGATAAKIKPARAALKEDGEGHVPHLVRCYCNGGGVFVDAAGMRKSGVTVLANYEDALNVGGGDGKAAVVHCQVGEGSAVLMGPHPEFAASLLPRQPEVPNYDDVLKSLVEDNQKRVDFFSACLQKLGLTINITVSLAPALSELHLSSFDGKDVSELLHALSEVSEKDGNGLEQIKAEFHTLRFIKDFKTLNMAGLRNALPSVPPSSQNVAPIVKDIIPHEAAYPTISTTPSFNHDLYYDSIRLYRGCEPKAQSWGAPLLYGSVIESTNTVLDKNPLFLSTLPTGFTVAATTQTSGRGRGSNVWVSPPGCLIFSTVINHPSNLAMSKPIVFLQYLAAIAIVEGIKTYSPGGMYGKMPVKLKWPNDVYARDPDWTGAKGDKPEYIKIGGILSSCSYEQGSYQVVIGIGVNTTNAKPTTSLNALLENMVAEVGGAEPYTVERLTARIITRLEALYERFCDVGFSHDLEQRYYAHWLHGGQEVTVYGDASGVVPAVGARPGPMKARVEGITTDWGMLKVRELDADGRPINKTWALQSNENSFDYWKGLIRRKL